MLIPPLKVLLFTFTHARPLALNFFTKTISEFLVDYKFKKRRKLSVGNISLKGDIGYAGEYTEAIFKLLQR